MERNDIISHLKSAASDELISDKWRVILTHAAMLLDDAGLIPEDEIRNQVDEWSDDIKRTIGRTTVDLAHLRAAYENGLRKGFQKRRVQVIGDGAISVASLDSWAVENAEIGKLVFSNSFSMEGVYRRGFHYGALWALRQNARRA